MWRGKCLGDVSPVNYQWIDIKLKLQHPVWIYMMILSPTPFLLMFLQLPPWTRCTSSEPIYEGNGLHPGWWETQDLALTCKNLNWWVAKEEKKKHKTCLEPNHGINFILGILSSLSNFHFEFPEISYEIIRKTTSNIITRQILGIGPSRSCNFCIHPILFNR